MIEDIESHVNRIRKGIEAFDDGDRNINTLLHLEFDLCLLKLALGDDRFAGLPTFVRYLDTVSKMISDHYAAEMEGKEETK